MIAYAFWHSPRAGTDEGVYAARLARFQEGLEQLGSGAGLAQDPLAFRLADVPWMGAGRPVYLDVYLLDGTAQMETLNAAAVTGNMVEPHAAIAALYGQGAGSLYQFRTGATPDGSTAWGYWFAKPAGMTYPELDAALGAILPVGGSVWRRMMVLGPSPEFWVISPVAIAFAWPVEERPLTAV